jgi:hypothetical protein
MRIAELVKTYKLINDPNAPNWSIRFVGAIAAGVLLLAGAGAIYWASGGHEGAPPNQIAATSEAAGDGTRTDYVGYLPSTFDAALGYDPARVDQALADWQIAHPGAQVLDQEAVWSASHVIGYRIHYR